MGGGRQMGGEGKGWGVGGGGVGGGGQASRRQASLPSGPDSGAVFSVGDRDVHKPQDRSRQPLAAARHPTNSD